MKMELWRVLPKSELFGLVKLRDRLEQQEQESDVDKLVREIRQDGDLRAGSGSGEGDMAKRSAAKR